MNKTNPLYKVKAMVGKLIIVVFGWLIDTFDKRVVFGDPHTIKGITEIEEKVNVIIDEYRNIIKEQKLQSVQSFFVEQSKITKADNWQSFPLFLFGHAFEENTIKCPETVRMLKAIEGMCAAMFSVLKAGAVITPHRGPYKGVLRYHLGLIIPEPAEQCFIVVDGKSRNWQKGQSLLFDDTHVHEAHNHTTSNRVVLFVDIIRPLPFPLNHINNILFRAIGKSEFIKEVFDNYSLNNYAETGIEKPKE